MRRREKAHSVGAHEQCADTALDARAHEARDGDAAAILPRVVLEVLREVKHRLRSFAQVAALEVPRVEHVKDATALGAGVFRAARLDEEVVERLRQEGGARGS